MVDAADQPLPGGEVLEFRMVEAEAAPGGTHGVMFDREERLIWFQVAPPTFRPLGAHPMHHAAVGPGGWPLYLAHDDGVRVMLEDGTEAPFFASGSAIYVLAISSDGRWLAAGDRERTTWVLDRESGAVRARMRGHRRRVSTLAFSPDSRTLATGSWDDTIRFWDLGVFEADPAVLLAEAETRWGLTADEVLRGR